MKNKNSKTSLHLLVCVLMKNEKFKMALHLLICILISLIFIYLNGCFWAWGLISTGDPILLEVVASVIVGTLVFLIYELSKSCETKFDTLTNKIEELEKLVVELRKKQ